jgi:hypothetical protein
MLQILALFLLVVGGLLEVAGIALFGLDLLIGLLFVAAAVLGAGSYLFTAQRRLGLVAASLGVGAFMLHLVLNLGFLVF